MTELWELEAREEIRRTVWTYAVSGDSGRVDDLAAQFTADGVLEVPSGERAVGREAIIAMLRSHAADGAPPPSDKPFFIRHHVSNILAQEVTPTAAKGVAYFAVYTPDGPDHWGRYRDEYAPVDGRWLLTYRRARVDSFVPGGWFHRVYKDHLD